MTTTIDTWVNVASPLIAPTLLPMPAAGGLGVGSIIRTTLDLTSKNGALLVGCLGRATVTGLAAGTQVYFRVRRLQLSSAFSVPADFISYSGGNTTAGVAVACSTNTCSSAAYVIPMGATPTTLGSLGNVNILFLGATTIASALTISVTQAMEWARLAMPFNAAATAGGTALVLDSPTRLARIASEYVIHNAEIVGPVFLEGGAVYEVLWDASSLTAGGPVAVACYYETLDAMTTT